MVLLNFYFRMEKNRDFFCDIRKKPLFLGRDVE